LIWLSWSTLKRTLTSGLASPCQWYFKIEEGSYMLIWLGSKLERDFAFC
jgi:hypothetical protein